MAVGMIVQLQRTIEGYRVISSITEVQGMEGDTVLLQDVFHRVGMANGAGRLVPTGLRPKILDELTAHGINIPPETFRPTPEDEPETSDSRAGRRGRPSRPGRAEPPSEELYEFLAQRRQNSK